MSRAPILVICLALLCAHAHAVVVAGSDGTQNTTAPTTNDFGFANVGRVFDSTDGFFTSGVYLGNGWMLSAYHEVRNGSGGFSFGSVYLSGTAYSVDTSTATRLTNSNGSSADLAMFRLTIVPSNINNLTIVSSEPNPNASLTMMGNGFDRATSTTYWTSNWAETTSPGFYSGYKELGTQSLRYGTNNLAGSATIDDGYGTTSTFYTDFDNTSGEAQAAAGDSGGGVFFKSGNTWELAGIMLTVNGPSGQPGNTAVFGDNTYAADLAQYRSQITSTLAVPEPATNALLVTGLAAVSIWLRRRRTTSFFCR